MAGSSPTRAKRAFRLKVSRVRPLRVNQGIEQATTNFEMISPKMTLIRIKGGKKGLPAKATTLKRMESVGILTALDRKTDLAS